MIQHETKIRVCYADTDKLGVVYYGNYPRFYEIARTEFLRNTGLTYKEIEKSGIVLPVRSVNITYFKPAYYDDLLTIKTILSEQPSVKLKIQSEIYNEQQELINASEIILVFTNAKSGKPTRPPETFLQAIENYRVKNKIEK
jgi:acyl-CoA thioester hydrolase